MAKFSYVTELNDQDNQKKDIKDNKPTFSYAVELNPGYKPPASIPQAELLSPGPRQNNDKTLSVKPLRDVPDFKVNPNSIPDKNPVVGEDLFLVNAFPIRQNDNPIVKGLKGIGNVGASIIEAPGEMYRKTMIQAGSVLSGNGIRTDLPKNTSFVEDILKPALPQGVSNTYDNFQQEHPILGNMANMAIETVADPTTFIGSKTITNLLTPQNELNMLKPYPVGQNEVQSALREPRVQKETGRTYFQPQSTSLRDIKQREYEQLFSPTPFKPQPRAEKPSQYFGSTTQADVEAAFPARKVNTYNFTTGYQKAVDELNQGMQIAQEQVKKMYPNVEGRFPFGSATLNSIKKETGIDIQALIENVKKAENKITKLTSEQRRLGKVAGVLPDLIPREKLPTPEPSKPLQYPSNLLWNPELKPSVPAKINLSKKPLLRDASIEAETRVKTSLPLAKVDSVSLGSKAKATEPLLQSDTAINAGTTQRVFSEPVIMEGKVERGFSKNTRTDANNPDALRDSFTENPLSYEQIHGVDTIAKAQAVFDQGYEVAITKVSDLASKMQPEAVPLAKMLARKATESGNVQGAREILSDVAEKLTQAGQFSQAARLLREADPETFLMTIGKQLKKLNKEGSEVYGKKWMDFDLTPDELDMVSKIERGNQQSYENAFEQIQSRIANEMPASAMEKINAWRHISMLLNPKTHIRNVGGNAIMMGMRKSAQRTSGVLQKVLLKESERTQSVFVNKEYKDLASEYFEANKKDLLGGANKYQENISVNMPDKRVFRKSRIGEKLGMDIDILEKVRKFNYELLQKGDNPFFQNAYIDRLASYAQVKGIKDFSKLSQEAFDIAKLEAEQATYKDASFIADFLNKAKRPEKSASLGRKTGAVLTEAALPFTKTPINIIKRGIQYSPIGIANGLAGIRSSKGAASAIDELAKGLTGTGVLGLGYLLASKGILTGKAEKDVDLKAYNANTGNSPFSVLGKYSYDWMQPFSVPLSVGVEIYNAVKDNPEDKAKMDSVIAKNDIEKLKQMAVGVSNAIVDGLNASGDTVFNMSIMKGVKNLLGGQQGFMEGLAQLPQGYATQFIPTVSNQLAGTIDPIVRQTYVKGNLPESFKNSMLSRIPLASKNLEPKQTPFGEDVKRIENPFGRAVSQFLSPGIITKNQNIDPEIDSELKRLNESGGFTKQFPTIVPNYIEKTQTNPKIELTPSETSQYQKRVGELTLSSFNKVMSKSSYLHPSVSKKNMSADEIRADLLAKAIAEAKAIAKKEILKSKGLK